MQAELDHQLKRRGMNRVAAKIAEEIGVLLQHRHMNAGAREQKPEHHPGRAAAGYAALRRDPCVGHPRSAPLGMVRPS